MRGATHLLSTLARRRAAARRGGGLGGQPRARRGVRRGAGRRTSRRRCSCRPLPRARRSTSCAASPWTCARRARPTTTPSWPRARSRSRRGPSSSTPSRTCARRPDRARSRSRSWTSARRPRRCSSRWAAGASSPGVATLLKARAPRFGSWRCSLRPRPPSPSRSASAGRSSPIRPAPTLADGLAGGIGEIAFDHRDLVDEIVTVTEAEIEDAIVALIARDQVVAEASGAVGVAAVRAAKLAGGARGPVVAIVTGANIDARVLRQLLARHGEDAEPVRVERPDDRRFAPRRRRERDRGGGGAWARSPWAGRARAWASRAARSRARSAAPLARAHGAAPRARSSRPFPSAWRSFLLEQLRPLRAHGRGVARALRERRAAVPRREAHHRHRRRGHGRAAAAGGRLGGHAERGLARVRVGPAHGGAALPRRLRPRLRLRGRRARRARRTPGAP